MTDRDVVALLICSPPYHGLESWALSGETSDPPLGSVACATGQNILAMLDRLVVVAQKWPWVAPCVALSAAEYDVSPAVLPDLLADRLAVLLASDLRLVAAEQLTVSVVRRKSPTSQTLARWVTGRLGAKDASEALEEQFAFALRERPSLGQSPATYSRVFRRYVALTARDWRALARLVFALHAALDKGHSTRAGLRRKGRHRVSSSLRRHSLRYLGMRWRAVIQLVGWEWVLELAIRRAGFGVS